MLLESHNHLQHSHTTANIVIAHLADLYQQLPLDVDSLKFSDLLQPSDHPVFLQLVEKYHYRLPSQLLQSPHERVIANEYNWPVYFGLPLFLLRFLLPLCFEFSVLSLLALLLTFFFLFLIFLLNLLHHLPRFDPSLNVGKYFL